MRKKIWRGVGTLLILVGVGILAGVGYYYWHQKQEYNDTQRDLREQITQEQPIVSQESATKAVPKQEQKKPAPREGEALGVLRISRFGSGYDPVIVEGVSQKALEKGPGHFPGTAMPGEIGNFSVAGHRTGWGEEFNRLPELKRGDQITVDWQGRSYTYHVTQTKVVNPSEVGVLLPVPNKPGVKPDKAWITLVTCKDRGVNGKYVNRLIVWGELDRKG